MSNVQPPQADFSDVESELHAIGSTIAAAFEDCFSSVRALRSQLNVTAGADATAQAFCEAVGALFDEGAVNAIVGDVASAPSSLQRQLAAIDAARDSQCDASQRLQRAANRPMTRLVAAMQSRDAIEQRISHIFQATDIIVRDETGKSLCLHTILAAQINGIRIAVTQVRENCQASAAALTEATRTARARYESAFAAASALKDVSASIAEAEGNQQAENRARIDELAESADMSALAQFDSLIGHAAALSSSLEGFVAVTHQLERCEELIAGRPAGNELDIADQSQRLFPLYTVDDERAIHKATLDRISMNR